MPEAQKIDQKKLKQQSEYTLKTLEILKANMESSIDLYNKALKIVEK